MSTIESPYKMTIGLNVLKHLSKNLYSNVTAVISEIVANAWDADAENVRIDIDRSESSITIYDDGEGMTRNDINKRYLYIGYPRRQDQGRDVTERFRRHVMGRKGIGKLSVFSIADRVEVHSVKGSEKNGFVMEADRIEEITRNTSENPGEIPVNYRPTPVDPENIEIEKGTLVKLDRLKRNLRITKAFSRKSIARRFSIIGGRQRFKVFINNQEVIVSDRDFFNKLELILYFGEASRHYADSATNALEKEPREGSISIGSTDNPESYSVKGWIGTLKNHSSEYKNTVSLLAHGKLVKEDVLQDIKEGRVFSDYLIGEVEADFLDADDKDDIITSDRQRILETDDRWRLIKEFIKNEFNYIGNKWNDMRIKNSVKRAEEIPEVKEWLETLRGDNKNSAKKLFGKIETLKIKDEQHRKELYRFGILAFEKLALKDRLSQLDEIEGEKSFELLKSIFNGVDDLEETLYYDITKGRLEIIEKLAVQAPDLNEIPVQKYLFDHLWLLDPSWERTTSNSRMEETVMNEFRSVDAELTDEEKRGRIDIRYKALTGKHVIIELKKYRTTVDINKLTTQIDKYRRALKKCLEGQYPGENHEIEIVCILGSPPTPRDEDKRNRKRLENIDARYITYDQLIKSAELSYKEYLKKSRERLSKTIAAIEGLSTDDSDRHDETRPENN